MSKRRLFLTAAAARRRGGPAALAVLHGRRDGEGWERLEGVRYAHRGLHGTRDLV